MEPTRADYRRPVFERHPCGGYFVTTTISRSLLFQTLCMAPKVKRWSITWILYQTHKNPLSYLTHSIVNPLQIFFSNKYKINSFLPLASLIYSSCFSLTLTTSKYLLNIFLIFNRHACRIDFYNVKMTF